MTAAQMLLSGSRASSWVRTEVGAPVLFATGARQASSADSYASYSYIAVEGATYSSIYTVGGDQNSSTTTVMTPVDRTPAAGAYGMLRGGQSNRYGTSAYAVGAQYDATSNTSAVQLSFPNGNATYVGASSIGNGDTLNDIALSTDTADLYIGVGDGGIIRKRASGTWSSLTSPTSNNLNSIVYGYFYRSASPGRWIAVGDTGTVIYSTDGTSWSTASSGVVYNLNDIAAYYDSTALPDYVNSLYAVGDHGTIRYSNDGATWGGITSGTTENLRAVAVAPYGYSDYFLFAVGDNGTVLYSTTAAPTTMLPLDVPVTDNFTSVAVGRTGIGAGTPTNAYSYVLMIGSQEGNILTLPVG